MATPLYRFGKAAHRRRSAVVAALLDRILLNLDVEGGNPKCHGPGERVTAGSGTTPYIVHINRIGVNSNG